MSSLTYKNSDALWHGRFIGWHFTPQMFPSNFGRYGQWLGPFATDFQWNSQPVHSKYPRKMRQPVQGSEFLDHAMSPCPHVLPTYYMLPTVNPFLVLIIGVDQRKKHSASPSEESACQSRSPHSPSGLQKGTARCPESTGQVGWILENPSQNRLDKYA